MELRDHAVLSLLVSHAICSLSTLCCVVINSVPWVCTSEQEFSGFLLPGNFFYMDFSSQDYKIRHHVEKGDQEKLFKKLTGTGGPPPTDRQLTQDTPKEFLSHGIIESLLLDSVIAAD